MFKVYYINFGYYGNNGDPFPSIESALDYAKSKSFQAAIYAFCHVRHPHEFTVVASWCPISGVKRF